MNSNSKKNNAYQFEFSKLYKDNMFNQTERVQKAKKTIAVINDYLETKSAYQKGLSPNFSVLDIGCSTGYLTKYYASQFNYVIGIDIDENAIKYARTHNSGQNLKYEIGDSLNLDFPDNSIDIVICTHIYEHVPDPKQMMNQIYRVLKPGGFCYFVAGNRLVLIEPHYRLPFLSIMPKWMANYYLRLTKNGKYYYENLLFLPDLKNIVKQFELTDYTVQVVSNPQKFNATDMITQNSIKQKFYLFVLGIAYFCCPSFIWILKK